VRTSRLAVSFDKVVEAYDSTRALSPDTMRQIVDTMQDVLRNCSTVLDVGIGTGRFACPLTEREFQVVGADISVPMMLKAREKGLSDVVRADALNLPFRNSAFDSVLLVHLLHLVDDWVNVVHEVGRVARLLVISLVGPSSGFRIRQSYLKLREEMGYPLGRFNEAEEGLRKLVAPAETRFVGEFSSEVKADAAIASLEKGDFAISWDLPLDIHRRIIERLRSEYGGKVFMRTDTFEVAAWKPEQLQRFDQVRV